MSGLAIDTGTDELLCELENGVATITLNRPEKRNALSSNLTPALRQCLLDFSLNDEVRCIVITGAGSAFCAGGDVSTMGGGTSSEDKSTDRTIEARVRDLQQRQETLTMRLFNHAKPTIAAIPGPAAGAGMSIALAADLRIMADSAFITSAFGNIGLSGDYGGSWLLTQLVGVAKAKELYYTAARIKAAECLALGIVNRVVPAESLMSETKSLAESIAARAPLALGHMKTNLNRAVTADLKTCLDLEAAAMVRCMHTEDHKEGVKAFMEKRAPNFAGR
ncbi:MAG: enoyl-CoA hydratase [Pseudomonadota bacterium]